MSAVETYPIYDHMQRDKNTANPIFFAYDGNIVAKVYSNNIPAVWNSIRVKVRRYIVKQIEWKIHYERGSVNPETLAAIIDLSLADEPT